MSEQVSGQGNGNGKVPDISAFAVESIHDPATNETKVQVVKDAQGRWEELVQLRKSQFNEGQYFGEATLGGVTYKVKAVPVHLLKGKTSDGKKALLGILEFGTKKGSETRFPKIVLFKKLVLEATRAIFPRPKAERSGSQAVD